MVEVLVTDVQWDMIEYDELDELDCPEWPASQWTFFAKSKFKDENEAREWIYERLSEWGGFCALDFKYSIVGG